MKFLLLLPVFLLGLLGACADTESLAAGSSSEVPNAIAGQVTDSLGAPVAQVTVRIRRTDYVPGLSAEALCPTCSTATDSAGRWATELLPGAWVATFQDEGAGDDRDPECDCEAEERSALAQIAITSETEAVRQDTVGRPGWVKGHIYGRFDSARVWVPGTSWHAVCSSDGDFILGPLPPQQLRVQARIDSAGVSLTDTRDVKAVSGDTVDAGTFHGDQWAGENYLLWPHMRMAVVDLTSKGADISGDHALFPVLVRLDSILDPDTVDRNSLRFDDGTGLHLPFEIETWDSSSHHADVWVRLDTANGQSCKHFLRAFWGRSTTMPKAPEVFSSAARYSGVWHPAATAQSPACAVTGATPIAGIVGRGLRFAGAGAMRFDSLQTGSWTVGFWIRPSVKPSGEILLLGSDTGETASQWGVSLRDDLCVRVWAGGSTNKELIDTTPLTVSRWTWISASYDSTTSRIELVVDTVAQARATLASYPKRSTHPVRGFVNFTGDVDEIRFARTVRAKEWQQLEHQTVRPGITWIHWYE